MLQNNLKISSKQKHVLDKFEIFTSTIVLHQIKNTLPGDKNV